MVQNRFRPYNKLLLVNVFMSNEYKDIWNKWYIPKYNEINVKNLLNKDVPLITSCIYNKINITKLLLSHPNIDVNIQDNNGNTALTCVIINRNALKISKLLLQRKDIDIYVRDIYKKSAIDYARGYIKINNAQDLINLLELYGEK